MYQVYSLFATLLLGSCLADQTPFYNDAKFDNGEYGQYVTQSFRSNPDVRTPVWNVNEPFTNCDDGSYLFIAPRGNVANSTPIILDASGSPVWAGIREYGEVYNLQVQQYKGESFLTFWAGNDAVGGHGAGQYHMLDKHYNERFKISAAHGLDADLHTFELTSDDTALSSIYDKQEVPFTSLPGDRERGWIWDSVFQDLDFETGSVLFEWRASEHFALTDSFTEPNAATVDDPWDAWHINSVQKDGAGNYLISFRFLRCVAYIDGRSGDVLWRLGGARNSFFDLSEGDATTFVGQHDAHLLSPDGRFLTLFDNRADWFYALEGRSRGKRVELDTQAMTARLDTTFVHPGPGPDILSISQGSVQTLPNGHVLVGYGFAGAVTEFSAAGEALCDVRFEPASDFGSGNVQSYRNLKFNWTGLPDTDPDLVREGSALYVSWNGATEVRSWVFQDADAEDVDGEAASPGAVSGFDDVLAVGKVGFETEIPIVEGIDFRRFVRVVGVDAEGNRLGKSKVVDIGELATYRGGEIEDGPHEGGDQGEGLQGEEEKANILAMLEDESGAADGEEEDFEDFFYTEVFEPLVVLGALTLLITMLVCLILFSRQLLRWIAEPFLDTDRRTGKLDSLFLKFTLLSGLRTGTSVSDAAATKHLMAEVDNAELEKGNVDSPNLH